VQEIHSPLRMAGGGEDGAVVVLEDLQPVGDVAGMVGPEVPARDRDRRRETPHPVPPGRR
jgi:hypothetical protein